MILYVLIFYVFMLVLSLLFFFIKRHRSFTVQNSFALSQKKPFQLFFFGKVKVSKYITLYECPECGHKSMEPSKNCPHCKANGKIVPLVAKTMPFHG